MNLACMNLGYIGLACIGLGYPDLGYSRCFLGKNLADMVHFEKILAHNYRDSAALLDNLMNSNCNLSGLVSLDGIPHHMDDCFLASSFSSPLLQLRKMSPQNTCMKFNSAYIITKRLLKKGKIFIRIG